MRPATAITVPIVPSVRHDGVRGRVAGPGRGKAMPQATISLELSLTGLRVASREASSLRSDVVFVIVVIRHLSQHRKAREVRTFLCVEPGLTP